MFLLKRTIIHLSLAFGFLASSAFVSGNARAFDLTELLVPNLARDWLADRVELFNGVDATQNSWFAYGGLGWSLNGPLDRGGFRVRFFGGSGRYVYTSGSLRHRSNVTAAEIMLGYQWQVGRLTAKLHAGPAYEEHDIAPPDPGNAAAGTNFGAKLLAETWLDLGANAWLSADASYFTATQGYAGFVRLGYRPFAWMAFGPEAAAFGNREYQALRAGVFVRLRYALTDITVSGGVSGDYESASGAYGSLSLYHKF